MGIRYPVVLASSRNVTLLFIYRAAESSSDAFVACSPLLLRKLHLAGFVYVRAINLDLLEPRDVTVNLIDMYLASVVLFEYLEDGLVLLLVNLKFRVVIGCHYSFQATNFLKLCSFIN